MLNNVKSDAIKYSASYANWLQLMTDYTGGYYEVAVSGKNALKKINELNEIYIPNKLIAGSSKESNIPLMQNRYN